MGNIIQSTCNYCSTGCNVNLEVEDGQVIKVRAADYTVNQGKVCPKGFNIIEPLRSETRCTSPQIKDSSGKFQKASWDEALSRFSERLKAIQAKHGKSAAAFISTGQAYTEEMAILGLVGRIGMGMEGDGNTRLCMATAVLAYKQAFGFDSPPFSYKDLEESDCLIFVGANPAINHPIIWERYKKNKQDHDLIVIDPIKTKTASRAHLFLPIKPRSDLYLYYCLAARLIEKNWIDRDFIKQHVTGFEDYAHHVASFSLDNLEERTGISVATLDQLAAKIHNRKRVSFWWTMGVNHGHEATRTAQALINLALITGNIGRIGTGANSITGQANAMGSRLFSNTTCLYGGRDYSNLEDRKISAEILGIDDEQIPKAPTLPYDKIIEGVHNGSIKMLWVVHTNPLHSWINSSQFAAALDKLELLVVQDLYADTATAQHADIFLPAAGFSEKEGFMINSERRLGPAQKAVEPPGEALSDFEIARQVGLAYGCEKLLKGWETPAKVFDILKRFTEGMPCDITGIKDYTMLLDKGGIQWPYPLGKEPEASERRLFEDGRFYTPDGKARMLFSAIKALPEETNNDYPMVLITGRSSQVQFHTQTRTGRVKMFNKIADPNKAYVSLCSHDAQQLGLEKDAPVRVLSRRGKHEGFVQINDGLQEGCVFCSMHDLTTNHLTFPVFDEFSREPGYKYAAVRVEKIV